MPSSSQTHGQPGADILSTVFTTSRDCICVVAPDGTISAMNPAGASYLGFDSAAAAIGSSWIDFWPEAERQAARSAMQAAGRGEPVRDLRGDCLAADGSEKVWESSITPVATAAGAPKALLIVSRDLTMQHRQMQAFHALERRYRGFVEAVSEIVWHYDVQQQNVWRHGWAEFTGQASDPHSPDMWLEAVHPDDRESARAITVHSAVSRQPFTTRYRLHHNSGAWRWVEDHAIPLIDESGQLVEWVGIVADIHDRITAETGLREGEERLRLAEQATGIGTWDVDVRTGKRQWSAELARLFGFAPGMDPTEEDIWACLHPDDRGVVEDHYAAGLLKSSSASTEPFRIVRKLSLIHI